MAVTAVSGGLLAVLLAASLRHAYPLGFAGFYALVADRIGSGGWALPARIPYYGGSPGGLPFAYPPLGLYLMAVAHQFLGIGDMAYLKVMPPIATALAVVPLYRFYRIWTGSGWTALLGVLLALTNPGMLVYQAFADGSVRGLAFLFMTAGLALSVRAIERGGRRDSALAALLFGCTVLTHVANALFFVLILAVLPLRARPWLPRYRRVLLVLLGGALLALPWVFLTVERHGLATFLYALHAHGSGSAAAALAAALPVSPLWYPAYVVGLAGAALCVMRRQYLLPAILALTIAMPDNARFVVMTVGLLAAIAVAEAMRLARTRMRRLIAGTVSGGVVVWGLLLFALWALWVHPLLTPSDVSAARWVRHETTPAVPQLVLSERREEAEWLPYMTARSGVIAEWGSEWTAQYETQHALFDRQAACLRRQSLHCVQAILPTTALRPGYLIVLHYHRYPRLITQLESSRRWVLVYRNSQNSVWRSSASSVS